MNLANCLYISGYTPETQEFEKKKIQFQFDYSYQ